MKDKSIRHVEEALLRLARRHRVPEIYTTQEIRREVFLRGEAPRLNSQSIQRLARSRMESDGGGQLEDGIWWRYARGVFVVTDEAPDAFAQASIRSHQDGAG